MEMPEVVLIECLHSRRGVEKVNQAYSVRAQIETVRRAREPAERPGCSGWRLAAGRIRRVFVYYCGVVAGRGLGALGWGRGLDLAGTFFYLPPDRL